MPYPQKVRKKASQSTTGELRLIERIRRRAVGTHAAELQLGIGDDCALLRLRAGDELVVTTDLSIDGRHFRLAWHPLEAIGHRTLARGLSDLAAMGARPLAAFLSLALPPDIANGKSIDQFLNGFFSLAAATGTPLAGGDLAESPIFAADIVLLGAVRTGRALLRSGARPGDLLYVTGALGGAAAGLAALARAKRKPRAGAPLHAVLARHLYPAPRLPQGQWLARHRAATAALDISDGLSTDLAHLCEASRVAAEIDLACLPIAPGATLEQALHGGEDYELLFTAAPGARVPGTIAGVAVTRIGRIVRRNVRRPMMTQLTASGPQPLTARGWEHFSGSV